MAATWVLLLIFFSCDCTKGNVNVIFLFDGSGSMEMKDFNMSKDFIWDIITNLKNSSIQFAAVQFSKDIRTVFTFEDYVKGNVKEKLDKEEHMISLTNTHRAIRFTLTHLFDEVTAGADPDAKKALVIITDGAPSDVDRGELKRCDELNIQRFIIGVGNVQLEKLRALASAPKENHTFNIQNYDGLKGLLDNLQNKIYNIEDCTKGSVNLIFLFDGSSSMLETEFNKNKGFIWDIITNLKNSFIQFAAVQFAKEVRTVFTFEDYVKGNVKEKLDKEEFMKTLTNTHRAIRFTLTHLFDNVAAGADPDAEKALVIITDGVPSDVDRGELKRCDELNIQRFIIGVRNVHMDKLHALASEPKEKNTFYIQNYDGLNGLLDYLQNKIYSIEGSKCGSKRVREKELSQTGFSAASSEDSLILGAV